jgi:4-alpha-glucanotransferase
VGWWNDAGGSASTLSRDEIERQRAHCRRYLGLRDEAEIHWAMIRAALASVADTAIVPLQDVLGLGREARMNLPGRPEGNWRWRLEEGCLGREVRDRLAGLTTLFSRAPGPRAEGPRG